MIWRKIFRWEFFHFIPLCENSFFRNFSLINCILVVIFYFGNDWWYSTLNSQIHNCCTFLWSVLQIDALLFHRCMKSSAWGKNLSPVLSTMKREKEVLFTFFAVILLSRKLYLIFHSTNHRKEGPYSKVRKKAFLKIK